MMQKTLPELEDKEKILPSQDSFRVPYQLLQLIMLNYHEDEWSFVTKGGNTVRAYRSTEPDHDFVLFTVNEDED